MILPLLLMAAAQAAAPPAAQSDEALMRQCVGTVKSDAEKAIEVANDWRMSGGGVLARQCLGLAYAELGRWEPAAVAFEQAARDAEAVQDRARGDYWVQSGNSWLAAQQGDKARAAFDAALATGLLSAPMRGEVAMDRARAGVLLGDLKTARKDMDRALELVPADPLGWLLSAALAMREEAFGRAQKDIAKALELAPNDPDVLLQAGNVAGAAGKVDEANSFYTRAAQIAPASDAGKAAQQALTANTQAAPPSAAPTTNTP